MYSQRLFHHNSSIFFIPFLHKRLLLQPERHNALCCTNYIWFYCTTWISLNYFLRGRPPMSWSKSIVFQYNIPTVPKRSFTALIHSHCFWKIQQLSPNFPYTPITIRGNKQYTFPSQALIAPPEDMSIPFSLVRRGGGSKNNTGSKSTDWYLTGGDSGIYQ